MHSRPLEDALTEFFGAAGAHLREEVAAGAEVPFELGSQTRRRGGSAATLYCYRALTGQFISEREPTLKRLPGHAESTRLLEHFDGLDRYLAGVGGEAARAKGRSRVPAALKALLEEVFDDQTDFQMRPERVEAALQRLQDSTLAKAGELVLVASLHGVTIASAELPLTKGLRIVQRDALQELPDAAAAIDAELAEDPLIVLYTAEPEDPAQGLRAGRAVLKDLLSALRLFGDGRVTLGALAWARIGAGSWTPLALGTGGRPHGMLVITGEQEDELRAFCNLVSRRAPHDNDLAWALRRFELGCERESSYEGLTDNLLALRALLEPEGASSGRLAGRLAALCATAEQRAELTERMVRAVALERSLIAGTAAKDGASEALAADVANHLRSLLRDVICGHLDPDLAVIADELLEPDELLHSDEDGDFEDVGSAAPQLEAAVLQAAALQSRQPLEEELFEDEAWDDADEPHEFEPDHGPSDLAAAQPGLEHAGAAAEPTDDFEDELEDSELEDREPIARREPVLHAAADRQETQEPLPIDGVVSTLG
ncbi:MAG TPA: hypothetical protein VHW67_04290 [Solirubrobacteraceae bacterium]|jgi:hypothetical protein|nr:hypothetical protein [Solirubrobacteraceae bacterium]